MKNLVHSISERLLGIAKRTNEPYPFVLSRYGVERTLSRLSRHPTGNRFVLKGASLFLIWEGHQYRTTQDVDLLGFGSSEIVDLERLFQELCAMDTLDEDGLAFDPKSIRASRIKEDQAYQGVRVCLVALLGRTRIHVQVDIGFGDAITPGPVPVKFPSLLDAQPTQLLAYPVETAIAEKFMAIVNLEMDNSRMKDFYDLMVISRSHKIDPALLAQAIRNTCAARKYPVPRSSPIGLSDAFSSDTNKQKQWNAFMARCAPTIKDAPLVDVVNEVRNFLTPTLLLLRE